VTRGHDVGQLSTAELELTMRELRANLGLISPGSPAHVPILAHMRAIDAELAGRASNQQPPAQKSATTAGYFLARLPRPFRATLIEIRRPRECRTDGR
jgi:hypothetical protein